MKLTDDDRYIVSSQYTSSTLIRTSHQKQAREVYTRIQSMLLEVWRLVRELLCNDAPEEMVIEDLDDETTITTKDVLSYSWRALRESR